MKKIKKLIELLLLVLTLGIPTAFALESNIVEVQAATTVATPKLVSAKASGTSKITFTWKAVSGANGYAVCRKTDGSSWRIIKTITNGRTVKYTDSKLKPGTRYYYSVRAYKKVGNKNVYGRYNTKGVYAVTGISKMKLTGKNTSAGVIALEWDAVKDITGYELYRKASDNSSWKKLKTLGKNSTGYTDSGLKVGITYAYKIRAYNKCSENIYRGAYSNTVSITLKNSDSSSNKPNNAATPNYEVTMNSKTNPSTNVALMLIENKGSKTLRIYARNARLIDSEYKSFDRDLIMVDPNALDDERLVPVSYINILPGRESFIPFVVDGKNTWYDHKSSIRYDFRYDGVDYWAHSSSYYGTKYYKD